MKVIKMRTISIQVDDKLINDVGMQTFQDYLKEQVEMLKFKMIYNSIAQSVKQSEIDLEKDLTEAKEKAWQRYKKEYLEDILKWD